MRTCVTSRNNRNYAGQLPFVKLAAGEVVIVHCYYTLVLNEARHVVVGVPLIPQYDAKVCMRMCVTFGNNRNYAGQVIIVHC